jgi:hypothetical protein
MLFDQLDDSFDLPGKASAEPLSRLLIPFARAKKLGAGGRMKANRHLLRITIS